MCVCVCAGLGLLLPFHFKKPGRNIALRHFLLKAQPAAVHLILNQPQLNEGTTERVCYQYNSDQSRVLGAWGPLTESRTAARALPSCLQIFLFFFQPIRTSDGILPADSPLHFFSVGLCIILLSEGWCRADRQAGTALPSNNTPHQFIHVLLFTTSAVCESLSWNCHLVPDSGSGSQSSLFWVLPASPDSYILYIWIIWMFRVWSAEHGVFLSF